MKFEINEFDDNYYYTLKDEGFLYVSEEFERLCDLYENYYKQLKILEEERNEQTST